MGAESSILQGCKLEEPLETPSQSDWRLHPAKRKDGSRVSVFVHKKSEQEDRRLENAAKQLKILRHPTILKFFASCDNVEGTYLITEQVRPLEIVLESLTPEEICAGLYNIAEALSFLHDRGGASHNNVCMSSIYVSVQDGGWRLGGMEHLCKFEDATVQFLNNSRSLRNAEAIPPEEQVDSKSSVAPQYGHARDAYAFGILAQNMLEYLTDLGSMSANFEQRINDEFLHSDPMMRPRLTTLLNDQLFKNDFLEIINFLVHLTVKSEAAKNGFFEGLAPRLHRLPQELVANRLAPLLLSSFVMAEPMAVSMVLPHFMTPLRESKSAHREFLSDQVNPLFSVDLFKKYIIPVILKIFPSRETHVRICLLQYFTFYVDLFNVDILKKGIIPQLLIGLKDSHDELVAASLRGLADVVPILGGQVVVGGERIRYFVEGKPKFIGHKESPLKNMDSVKNLTAVSGMITIPPLEKTPPTRTSPAPVSNGKPHSEAEEEVVEAVAKRQEERERRRQEMRLKNEQRRMEREAKRTQPSGKAVTLLSMANVRKESTDSAVDSHTGEELPRSENTASPVEIEDKWEEQEIKNDEDLDVFDPHKEEDDWSDWADVNQPEDRTGSEQDMDMDQSGATLLREVNKPLEAELTAAEPAVSGRGRKDDSSDWSRVQSDWNQVNSDWSGASETRQVTSKKPSKSLQLKKPPPMKLSPEPKTETKKATSQPPDLKSSSKMPSKVVKVKKSDDLGSEYSIPDIVVAPKVKTEEMDFFADMAPSLSFTGTSRTLKKGSSSKTSPQSADKSPSASVRNTELTQSSISMLSFEASPLSAGVEDDGDGWGTEDNFDWDEVES